ncbi:hypothetical protein OAA91_00505 [Fibrobacterales bacterium]|nr:hypothetical protein [Fibrobacterales bacterium]
MKTYTEKALAMKVEFENSQANFTAVQANLDLKQKELKVAQELPDSPDKDAKIAAVQADITTQTEKLGSAQGEMDKVTAKRAKFEEEFKYQIPGVKGSATSEAVKGFDIPTAKEIQLANVPTALVTFSLDRQIILEAYIDNKDEKLSPGMLNDNADYWEPQTKALNEIWAKFASEQKSLLGDKLVEMTQVSSNADYQKVIIANAKPLSILGMKIEKEEIHPEGLGMIILRKSEEAKSIAAALKVEQLVSIELSAKYAAYDGKYQDGMLNLRLSANVKVTDASGKLVKENSYHVISKNEGMVLSNSMYDKAVTTLSVESFDDLLTLLKSKISVQ